MCYGGLWGSICPFAFGDSDAQVACRQLNYSAIGTLLVSLSFFPFSQQVLLSQILLAKVYGQHTVYTSHVQAMKLHY